MTPELILAFLATSIASFFLGRFDRKRSEEKRLEHLQWQEEEESKRLSEEIQEANFQREAELIMVEFRKALTGGFSFKEILEWAQDQAYSPPESLSATPLFPWELAEIRKGRTLALEGTFTGTKISPKLLQIFKGRDILAEMKKVSDTQESIQRSSSVSPKKPSQGSRRNLNDLKKRLSICDCSDPNCPCNGTKLYK